MVSPGAYAAECPLALGPIRGAGPWEVEDACARWFWTCSAILRWSAASARIFRIAAACSGCRACRHQAAHAALKRMVFCSSSDDILLGVSLRLRKPSIGIARQPLPCRERPKETNCSEPPGLSSYLPGEFDRKTVHTTT